MLLVINVPDTVGYSTPEEFGKLIRNIKNNVSNIDKVSISVHCHNDLGMAVANTLAAIQNGATQVETTINGLGEESRKCSNGRSSYGDEYKKGFLWF